MNAEVKAKWVAALRSGDYKQTTGRLKTILGHCCLGVLCEVGVKESVLDSYYHTAGEPPSVVLDWAEWDRYEQLSHLIQMNDVLGLSFDKIADWIEENL